MEDYYNGPLAGYTDEEMASLIGEAVLRLINEQGMQLTWKPKP